jgi:hypothetical protein
MDRQTVYSPLKALPRLLGNFQTTIDAARIYVPDQLTVITSHEPQTLEESIPSEVAQLDYVKSQVATPRRELDMNSFLRASQATLSP